MVERCDIKNSIEKGFDKVNYTLNLYAKNKESYDIQRDSHWIATRQIEERVSKVEDSLYSEEKGRPGLLEQVSGINNKVDRLFVVLYAGGGIMGFIYALPVIKELFK